MLPKILLYLWFVIFSCFILKENSNVIELAMLWFTIQISFKIQELHDKLDKVIEEKKNV